MKPFQSKAQRETPEREQVLFSNNISAYKKDVSQWKNPKIWEGSDWKQTYEMNVQCILVSTYNLYCRYIYYF